jgi:hypothetical protein
MLIPTLSVMSFWPAVFRLAHLNHAEPTQNR